MTVEIYPAYVNAFINERPKDGFDISQNRIASTVRLNEELAEYFKDRAQIEDTYAKSMEKLRKKDYISNKSALGTFLPLWEMLQIELMELATMHAEYSLNIDQNVEKPLRAFTASIKEYNETHPLKDSLSKLIKECDDIEIKIHKSKNNKKNQSKVASLIQQQEQNLREWQEYAPQFLQKAQSIDYDQWNSIKSVVTEFELIQQAQCQRVTELAKRTMAVTSELDIDTEIMAFCASYSPLTVPSMGQQLQQKQQQPERQPVEDAPPQQLVDTTFENNNSSKSIVLQPSTSTTSNASRRLKSKSSFSKLPQVSSPTKSKKFFSFVPNRFKSTTKLEKNYSSHLHNELSSEINVGIHTRQRSSSNAGSSSRVESSSLHSITTHGSTMDHDLATIHNKSASSNNLDLITPGSPTSVNAPSFNEFVTNNSAPLIMVDSEGYSIPPPDRAAWPAAAAIDMVTATDNDGIPSNSEIVLESAVSQSLFNDDKSSDAGSSLFSSIGGGSGMNRIKVDIKSEASKEDVEQSETALYRVSTLLKEKSSAGSFGASGGSGSAGRRLRGRREIKQPTQLYSLMEQQQQQQQQQQSLENATIEIVSPFRQHSVDEQPPSSPFSNPFDMAMTQDPTFTITDNGDELTPPPSPSPEINVGIVETIHADAESKSAVLGEITIEYQGAATTISDSTKPICFQLKSNAHFDEIECAHPGIQPFVNAHYTAADNVFQLVDPSAFPSIPVVCITYKTSSHSSLPLAIEPLWKCEKNKSRMLIRYNAVKELRNVVFATLVSEDLQNALSIPEGQLTPDGKRIVWNMNHLDQGDGSEIKAQFITLEQAIPQPVFVKFETDSVLTETRVEEEKRNGDHDEFVVWAKVKDVKTVWKVKYPCHQSH